MALVFIEQNGEEVFDIQDFTSLKFSSLFQDLPFPVSTRLHHLDNTHHLDTVAQVFLACSSALILLDRDFSDGLDICNCEKDARLSHNDDRHYRSCYDASMDEDWILIDLSFATDRENACRRILDPSYKSLSFVF